MPDLKNSLEKLILGKTLKEAYRDVPSYDNIIEGFTKQLFSNHPVRLLGYSNEGEVWLSEEDRENHLEIIGAPGEGKSKFLEMMACKDIESLMKGKVKSGLCFIDSSDNGNTMRKILRYCCKKGFDIDEISLWMIESILTQTEIGSWRKPHIGQLGKGIFAETLRALV